MSLKAFHVLFITASVLLAFGMAAWLRGRSPAGAAAAVLVGLALIGYEVWFLRKARRVP
jgi:Flp pilus assembly protein TadB